MPQDAAAALTQRAEPVVEALAELEHASPDLDDWLPPPPEAETSDRMFLLSEFQAVQDQLGRTFTFDAACNDDGGNRLCERFACVRRH